MSKMQCNVQSSVEQGQYCPKLKTTVWSSGLLPSACDRMSSDWRIVWKHWIMQNTLVKNKLTGWNNSKYSVAYMFDLFMHGKMGKDIQIWLCSYSAPDNVSTIPTVLVMIRTEYQAFIFMPIRTILLVCRIDKCLYDIAPSSFKD